MKYIIQFLSQVVATILRNRKAPNHCHIAYGLHFESSAGTTSNMPQKSVLELFYMQCGLSSPRRDGSIAIGGASGDSSRTCWSALW